MKRLFLPLLFLFFLASCKKQEDVKLQSPKGAEFFKSKAQLASELKTAIGQDFGTLSSLDIKNIDYYEDPVKSIGLITYKANGNEYKNIIFIVTATSKKTFKCTALDCKCSVEITPTPDGNAYDCGGCNTNCHWEVTSN